MGSLGRLSVSSSSSCVDAERDPTSVPGKPFLEHLHRALNGVGSEEEERASDIPALLKPQHRTSSKQLLTNQHATTLAINAPCLCYLQKLFFAMLTPTKSEYSGMITQWRLNAAFARLLEENPESTANLGVASPQCVLQLAGRLLEVEILHLEALPSEGHLPMPSDCDLIMFPKLHHLYVDGVKLELVHGLPSIADTLTELHFVNGTLPSVTSLLSSGDATPVIKWRNLRRLSVDNVQLDHVEATAIALAPNVEVVSFCQTGLVDIGPIIQWTWLSTLDLSHNHLHTIDLPARALQQLKVLNLSHNRISSVQGLRTCLCLEVLDFSHNLILTLDTLQELAVLHQLRSVELYGNPVAKHRAYRHNARTLLAENVVLDQFPWTTDDALQDSCAVRSKRVDLQEADHVSVTKTPQRTVSRVDAWSAGRGILRSCLAIGFAQVVVSTVWARDAETEQLTWQILVVTTGLAVISITLVFAVSWVFRTCRRKLCPPRRQDKPLDVEETSPGKPMATVQMLTRGLFANLTIQELRALGDDADARLRIHVIRASLHAAVGAGDRLSTHDLIDVCTQLKTIIAFLSGPDGNGIGFAWLRLNRALVSFGRESAGREERIRDRLSSRLSLVLDAAEPSTSFVTSLSKILPVLRLCAIVFSSITLESDAAQILRDAYVQVFASYHHWWRQRSILAGITGAPDIYAFLSWLNSPHDSSHQHLLKDLHKCGERLHVLYALLQDLVDEHIHSFAYPS